MTTEDGGRDRIRDTLCGHSCDCKTSFQAVLIVDGLSGKGHGVVFLCRLSGKLVRRII